jgi:hypothetical protein
VEGLVENLLPVKTSGNDAAVAVLDEPRLTRVTLSRMSTIAWVSLGMTYEGTQTDLTSAIVLLLLFRRLLCSSRSTSEDAALILVPKGNAELEV